MSSDAAVTREDRLDQSRSNLPTRALAFLTLLGLATAAAAVPLLPSLAGGVPVDSWISFGVLAAAAAASHLFLVRVPGSKRAYHASIVFLVAGALILPPELLILMGVVTNLPEWLKERYPWYMQSFNIFNYTLATLGAWGAARVVAGPELLAGSGGVETALAGAAACAVFVALNHLVLVGMVHLARGTSFREIGLFDGQWLWTDLVLTALGVVFATFWHSNLWLVAFALAPLLLIHRALSVPQLQAEARVDPKTGLFNARHFSLALTEEIGRAERFERPLSLIMADLDLLREINNNYGHLAGDAVLRGIADIFRAELRHYDVPARFGGEEFSILLPETPPEEAMVIAERIRRAVADRRFDVETSSEPICATVSIGISSYPTDAQDPDALVHQADLAVYRAKLQGRNRVLGASSEPLHKALSHSERLVAVPEEESDRTSVVTTVERAPAREHPHTRRTTAAPRFLQLSRPLRVVVGSVSMLGIAAGVAGLLFGGSTDVVGMLAIVALVGVGQALALELDDGAISVSAVGALAGAAMFGSRVALAIALATALVDWSARRPTVYNVLFNTGALTLSGLAATLVFSTGITGGLAELATVLTGLAAGAAYFVVHTGLFAFAVSLESRESWRPGWQERFLWLAPHYVVYGFIGGVITLAYHAVGLYALAVFAVPLLLMRKTQEAYLARTRKSAQKLRHAAETIHTQNVSLEEANRLLKERSTAAMESLSATVDARDAAGHSRRVQQLALALGRELELSQAELDLLGYAALFHDIGKLAIPDAVLLKPAGLSEEEWSLMKRHADESARFIARLGFLNDAVPAIRHHHERFDGTGYPDQLLGEEIPLGARIIHVADALDSMVTTRIYRAARPPEEALVELRGAAGTQFCPRCVSALERILPDESLVDHAELRRKLFAVS